jgi:hypothetical protein
MRFDKDEIDLVRAHAEASTGGGCGHYMPTRKRDLLINALEIFMYRSDSRGFRPSPLGRYAYTPIRQWHRRSCSIPGVDTDRLKTLLIIRPTLSHNLELVMLEEREPTPAAIGISTLIRSIWSTTDRCVQSKITDITIPLA